ncbi:MAG: hypothetical protein ABIR47_08770, partial [Candidatus Kapaibacterium sp.]
MSEALSDDHPKKRRKQKRRSVDDLNLPPELKEMFLAAVKEAAGKPLSMAPGSPLGRVIGAFVEHSLTE